MCAVYGHFTASEKSVNAQWQSVKEKKFQVAAVVSMAVSIHNCLFNKTLRWMAVRYGTKIDPLKKYDLNLNLSFKFDLKFRTYSNFNLEPSNLSPTRGPSKGSESDEWVSH